MHALLLILVGGAAGISTHNGIVGAYTSGTGDEPKVMGIKASSLMTGLGVAGLLFGGPIIAAAGAGMALGGLLSNATIKGERAAFNAGVQKAITGGYTPAAPGAGGPGGGKPVGVLEWLRRQVQTAPQGAAR